MDPKLEKQRLFEAIPIEDDVLAEATKAMKDARRKLGLGPSVITSIVVGLCHFVFTRTIDTFAVKLTGDGNPMLMTNPDFLLKIGPEQAVFALSHEAYHLLMVHLYTDIELKKNPNYTTATEACINYRIKKHLGLPLIQLDGKTVIVDPDKVYESYRDGMKKQGSVPVTKEDFYATDIGCMAHLDQLPKPLQPKNTQSCVHASEGAGAGGMDSKAPQDPTEVGKFMDKVVAGAIQSAKNGRKGAKEEVLAWVDASPEAAQMWGDHGAGTLRGEATASRKTDLWEKWTAEAMASKMRAGNRWKYNRKIPFDPRVSANGKQPKKHGAVFTDESGSMQQDFLNKVHGLIQEMEELEVEWHGFDACVYPFNIGDPILGGGGTSFQIIEDHVTAQGASNGQGELCCEEDLDFVLVITDGYAPHIQPSDPGKWIWLITKGGDAWPQDAGMSCREVDLD